MLTEAEAKTKWCPLARASNNGDQPVSINRVSKTPDPDCLCIASDCMAWRWGPAMSADVNGTIHLGHIKGGRVIEAGYCGAFGNPLAGAA